MLLSRVWFLVLAVAAILGLSTALVARGYINREQADHVDEQLRRDRFGAELLMKLDARARIDALAPIAADGEVREALRKKRGDGPEPKGLHERLRTMNQHLEELRADLLIALDGDGTIVAQEGRRAAKNGAGLGKLPLVERALAGFLGDDVWVYDGEVYRVAARPVIDRGQYVGAIVHAQKLDAGLAQRMSERLGGASLGFFFRDNVIASYAPTDRPGAITAQEIAPRLGEARADAKLVRGERTEPFDLAGRGRAVFSLVAGSASAAEVGYVVARTYATLPTPWAVFDHAKKEDIDALPKLWLALAVVGLFLIAMGIMWLERDRPLAIFRKQVERIASGEAEELDLPHLIRQHRKVGEAMHRAIEKMVERGGGGRLKPKANLDAILGDEPANLASSAFSFGGADKGPATVPQPVPLPPPAPPPASTGRMPPPTPRAPAPPVPRPGRDDDEASVSMRFDAIAHNVPMRIANQNGKPLSADEEQHFREVFSKFVALRAQCGETTGELTFDRFLGTLQKHRAQILQTRPDAGGVHFTVYEKAGKAALRAAPRKA
ncbi:MAG: MXAN_5187 C-terminal domain-containing protein [Polyangiales bacterium]